MKGSRATLKVHGLGFSVKLEKNSGDSCSHPSHNARCVLSRASKYAKSQGCNFGARKLMTLARKLALRPCPGKKSRMLSKRDIPSIISGIPVSCAVYSVSKGYETLCKTGV